MISKKSRNRIRNDDPVRIYGMSDFTDQLPRINSERLANILAVRAEFDEILNKILSVSLAFQTPTLDIASISGVLNYALYVPELVSDSEGHEQILDEVLFQIEQLAKKGNPGLAKQIAMYSLERGHEMLENFDEGFSWNGSLEEIEKWLTQTGKK
jgi:hypothetical protein